MIYHTKKRLLLKTHLLLFFQAYMLSMTLAEQYIPALTQMVQGVQATYAAMNMSTPSMGFYLNEAAIKMATIGTLAQDINLSFLFDYMMVPGFNIEDFYSRVAYTIAYNLPHMDDLINKVTPTLDSVADNTNLQGSV